MTKVLVAGDIGQPVYHVGDEAMTVASATFFAGRGARIVLATRDEEHSRQLIGAGAAGGGGVGFALSDGLLEAFGGLGTRGERLIDDFGGGGLIESQAGAQRRGGHHQIL